ncbi:MAG: AAA family ATPase [Bacteroidia bacterium]|jgi:hypothetical protein|nr:AAA family ATPase [Bacteroidia bacterium]
MIFNHFRHINLTGDQRNALEKLQAFLESNDRVFMLKGYAGSGKTTLLKGLVEYLKSQEKPYRLMAPTGRAAKVIRQKTGFEATTIHKGIYSFDRMIELKRKDEEKDEEEASYFYYYELRNDPDIHHAVLIVDEASMVSDVLSEGEFFRFGSGHLLRDLLQFGRINNPAADSKLIFVGDPAQLAPIGMNFSPALDAAYLKESYDLEALEVEMKEVRRQQARNGIMQAATRIRHCLTSGFFNDFDLRENGKNIFNPGYEEFIDRYFAEEKQKIIISHTNKTALELNKSIRRHKYGNDLPIQATDTVIIGGNNYRLGILNGEFAIVTEASPVTVSREINFNDTGGIKRKVLLSWRWVSLVLPDNEGVTKTVSGLMLENYLYGDNTLRPEEQKALFIDFKKRHPHLKPRSPEFKTAITADEYFNCILLKFGYAVTCHKAQGGEWDSAFVFWDYGINDDKFDFYTGKQTSKGRTNEQFYRWAYTAVTRAANQLNCINPPYFTSFSGMLFMEADVQNAFVELTGQPLTAVEIDFDEVLPELRRFGLENAPLTMQDHFIHRWYALRRHYIDIAGWERKGFEIWYLFAREGKTVGMKYFVNGKGEFNKTYQDKIPKLTNSDELFGEIVQILQRAPGIVVNRNTASGILTQIEFDLQIEEEKPFLKNLFESISRELSDKETITGIQHLEYRERYTIESSGQKCVIDFEYNMNGFFGRVLPLEKKCNSPQLLARIKSIVNKLKAVEHDL